MSVNNQKTCPKCGNKLSDNAVFCERCGARIFLNKSGEDTVDPYLGKVIDDTFEVESVLGTGSMGIVYKAWHRMLKCHVALKVLRHDFISDRLILQRFQREAEAANKLSHPNVIRVLHFGRTSLQAPYIVMECLEGIELAQLVLQEFPLNQRRVCLIAIQIARALRAAHAANIIHRDLKPANIIIVNQNREEIVKVLDFGIAKIAEGKGEGLTREGAICGTPAFMSPEQIAGRKVTPATDIFSFGSILYYMLTCKLPFQGTELLELATTILGTEPTPPGKVRLDSYVDPNLEAICLKALQKDIENRFRTSAELVDALEAVLPQIPFANPGKRPKLVVDAPSGQKVDQNAKTRCEIPIFEDDEKTTIAQQARLDEGDTLDNEVTVARPAPKGASVSNMPSVSRSPSAPGPSVPRSPSAPVPSVPRSPSASGPSMPRSSSASMPSVPSVPRAPSVPRLPTPAQASAETLHDANISLRALANERTKINQPAAESVRSTIKKRKKLFMVIVCSVIVVCLLVLIFIIALRSVNSKAASADPFNIEEEEAESKALKARAQAAAQAAREAEEARARLRTQCETVTPTLENSYALGVVYGVVPEFAQLNNAIRAKAKDAENAGNAGNAAENGDGAGNDAVAGDSAKSGESAGSSPEPAAPRAARNDASVRKPVVKKTNSSGASAMLERATSLEASNKKAQACAIYQKLARESGLSASERNKVNAGLRRCQRN